MLLLRAAALRQTRGKGLVFGCSQALLEGCQDLGHIALEQSGYGQLQAGKHPTVDHAGSLRRQRRIAVFRPLEPINPPVVHLPDKERAACSDDSLFLQILDRFRAQAQQVLIHLGVVLAQERGGFEVER